MPAQLRGIINGKYIELDCEPGLPSGSVVIVNIQVKPPTLEEKRQMVDGLCGAWQDDSTLGPILAELEQQRLETAPREVSFHKEYWHAACCSRLQLSNAELQDG